MNEVTPAHLMMVIGALGLVVPAITAIMMLMLQRMFGGTDKASAEVGALKEKVHALELAQVSQYATRQDVESLRKEIRDRFTGLENLMAPILKQMGFNAVMT